jgi:hypothetical protein
MIGRSPGFTAAGGPMPTEASGELAHKCHHKRSVLTGLVGVMVIVQPDQYRKINPQF